MNQFPHPDIVQNEADETIAARIREILQRKDRALVAIDGNCCAGKTTTAERLGEKLHATVFHMDDYFLRPHMRTSDRLNLPGGNIDAGRFLLDVLHPVSHGKAAHVRRYDCRTDELLPAVEVLPGSVVVVEGAYSQHPLLAPYYDLKIFCRVSAETQVQRIRARNGEDELPVFLERWIPLENWYFSALKIEENCDIVIDSTPN